MNKAQRKTWLALALLSATGVSAYFLPADDSHLLLLAAVGLGTLFLFPIRR